MNREYSNKHKKSAYSRIRHFFVITFEYIIPNVQSIEIKEHFAPLQERQLETLSLFGCLHLHVECKFAFHYR